MRSVYWFYRTDSENLSFFNFKYQQYVIKMYLKKTFWSNKKKIDSIFNKFIFCFLLIFNTLTSRSLTQGVKLGGNVT